MISEVFSNVNDSTRCHLLTRALGLGSSPDLANSTAVTQHLLSRGDPAKSTSKTLQVHTLREGRSRDANYSAFSETKIRPFPTSMGERCQPSAQPRRARNTEVGSSVSLRWLLSGQGPCFPQQPSALGSLPVKPELPQSGQTWDFHREAPAWENIVSALIIHYRGHQSHQDSPSLSSEWGKFCKWPMIVNLGCYITIL